MEKNTKIRAIITGVTGMVGEGVLLQCLQSDDVEAILIIGRKPYDIEHPKVKQVVHKDFFDISPIESELAGYNACFFCLGVSSVGMKEPEYFKLTHTLTLHVAGTLSRINPDMVFCYVSGSGTDTTENGKLMWARVKGKTENDLMKLPFKKAYAFRPGVMQPTEGAKNTLSLYKYFRWLFPILRTFFPNFLSRLSQVGDAMIKVVKYGYEKNILEVKDINALADRQFVD
ncbi:epimerase [Dyadobacter bucti]|uniref:epimerase n=1 Tax=Dyadobacter bucti TaxID=2572203 RepID=UPI001109A47E|nr:epimerase [Dyadobacter bucti]